jgi:hypothetical protein
LKRCQKIGALWDVLLPPKKKNYLLVERKDKRNNINFVENEKISKGWCFAAATAASKEMELNWLMLKRCQKIGFYCKWLQENLFLLQVASKELYWFLYHLRWSKKKDINEIVLK